MPSRNIQAHILTFNRERRPGGEILTKGDYYYAEKTWKEIIVLHPLYGADCGYGTTYNWL